VPPPRRVLRFDEEGGGGRAGTGVTDTCSCWKPARRDAGAADHAPPSPVLCCAACRPVVDRAAFTASFQEANDPQTSPGSRLRPTDGGHLSYRGDSADPVQVDDDGGWRSGPVSTGGPGVWGWGWACGKRVRRRWAARGTQAPRPGRWRSRSRQNFARLAGGRAVTANAGAPGTIPCFAARGTIQGADPGRRPRRCLESHVDGHPKVVGRGRGVTAGEAVGARRRPIGPEWGRFSCTSREPVYWKGSRATRADRCGRGRLAEVNVRDPPPNYGLGRACLRGVEGAPGRVAGFWSRDHRAGRGPCCQGASGGVRGPG